MIEFDDSDQLNDGELESFDSQELAQKRSRNEALVGAANAAANAIIDVVARDPQVKVDRQQFLQQQFANSPCLDKILLHGPRSVYELEMLAQKAYVMVCSEAEEISAAGVSIQYYEFWIHVVRMEAYSGVVNNDPYHPVNDHPRKHRKTRPVVYL